LAPASLSALGVLLKEVEPGLTIATFETLHDCAEESSNGWNNAGTGHAGNCELYFTPQRKDGSVDICRALEVNIEFDISRQLWSLHALAMSVPRGPPPLKLFDRTRTRTRGGRSKPR
jgi:malate dehydrogenase (quinone)